MKIERDKIFHFTVSCVAVIIMAAISFALGEVLQWILDKTVITKFAAVLCGATYSLGLGLGKEYGDSQAAGNEWGWKDIWADLLGILAGIIISTIALLLY